LCKGKRDLPHFSFREEKERRNVVAARFVDKQHCASSRAAPRRGCSDEGPASALAPGCFCGRWPLYKRLRF